MKLIRPQNYFTVESSPVGDVRFSPSSSARLNSPQALDYARKHGMCLQSLGYAIVTRVALYNADKEDGQGVDHSDDYQKTITLSLKWKNNGRLVGGFAELEDDDLSRKLVQDGYDLKRSGKELICSRDDPVVSKLVECARQCPVLKTRPLEFSTEQRGGKSVYGSNDTVVAATGSRAIAEFNAGYLLDKGCRIGCVLDFTEEDLEDLLRGNENGVVICPVGLGGDVFNDVNIIFADGSFSIDGRARGSAHVGAQKISGEPLVLPLRAK
jgi:hypothetical protein